MLPQSTFWSAKRVLITGHTGFKGAWLALWLQRLGAQVTGIALPALANPNLYQATALDSGLTSHFCDIRDPVALAQLVQQAQPEIVFHLAAQALVRASYRDPLHTLATNIMGTAHLLDALKTCSSLRAAVMVTTDKVYRNLEHAYPYREDDALGGHDPYSASKAACETVIDSYRAAFLAEKGIAVASARAGNVIGGGDWSEDRIIPDAVRAWQAGQTLPLRSPDAIRPWQHVLEPLAGYLRLAEVLWAQPSLAGAFNFGPNTHEAATVRYVINLAAGAYPESAVSYENNSNGPHEAGRLALETAKARRLLGIQPRWPLPEAVVRTMAWYRAYHAGVDARRLCDADIDAYEATP